MQTAKKYIYMQTVIRLRHIYMKTAIIKHIIYANCYIAYLCAQTSMKYIHIQTLMKNNYN